MFKTDNRFQSNGNEGFISLAIRQKAESQNRFYKVRQFAKIVKGTVMQIEKAPINDRLRISKVS